MAKSKQPQTKYDISDDKIPRVRANPESYLSQHPSWNFSRVDQSGLWAFSESELKNSFWTNILPKLKDFEKMTWGDIVYRSNNNHHSISVSGLNKIARDRLNELKIYDDEIFSLRLTGNHRIYGIRYNSVLSILWYDTNHGDNDTCVCRSILKHT